MINIGIIIGTTRPGRFCIQPGNWVYELARKQGGANVDLIDLQKVGLPLLDEATPPSMGQYEHEHTKRWAERVNNLDGFVFVTAEYNHSIPGALKNAIDFLFQEWNYKPASFVSYGGASGGSRSVEHLRGVMGELKVYDLREQVLLPQYFTRLNDQGQYQFSEAENQAATTVIRDTIFWAEQMKVAREKLG